MGLRHYCSQLVILPTKNNIDFVRKLLEKMFSTNPYKNLKYSNGSDYIKIGDDKYAKCNRKSYNYI